MTEEVKYKNICLGAESISSFLEPFLGPAKLGKLPRVILLDGGGRLDKDLYALAYAALFYCETQSACGSCACCIQLQKEQQAEFLMIEESEEKNLKLEIATLVQDHLALKSTNHKIPRGVMLSGVERLTSQAANSLLKILEEPPENVLIILTTLYPKQVLSTLRSRTVRIALPHQNLDFLDKALHDFLTKMICMNHEADRMQWIDREFSKLKIESHHHLIRELEIVLNRFYKQEEQKSEFCLDPLWVYDRRCVLSQLRQHRSPFNLRLILERLFLNSGTVVEMRGI